MELYLRQQFDLLLQEATGNYAERLTHRAGGPEAARAALRDDPDGPLAGRADFVTAFFADNLLDNTAGRCFVLEALERRALPADPGGPASQVLERLAAAAFAEVLTTRTTQLISQQQVYS